MHSVLVYKSLHSRLRNMCMACTHTCIQKHACNQKVSRSLSPNKHLSISISVRNMGCTYIFWNPNDLWKLVSFEVWFHIAVALTFFFIGKDYIDPYVERYPFMKAILAENQTLITSQNLQWCWWQELRRRKIFCQQHSKFVTNITVTDKLIRSIFQQAKAQRWIQFCSEVRFW